MRYLMLWASLVWISAGSAAVAQTDRQAQLCGAATSGSPAEIADLISKGADANAACDQARRRPLDFAINVARVDNMEALIKAGASVNGSPSRRPLGFVRNAASAALLLKHQADPNAIDDLGYSPLIKAPMNIYNNFPGFYQMTEQDVVEIATVLIAHGADVTFADEFGNTPLTEAAFSCQPNVVRLLLDKGANVNARSASQTALGRLQSIKSMHPEVCGRTEQILLAHGATK